jgi:phytoene desaturase
MSQSSPENLAVIGSGLAGLAAAARLAHAGSRVTVFEKEERVGGKMNQARWQGYRWDTGPSLLTMPFVLEELWSDLGQEFPGALQMRRLPNTCRYRWRDGTVIDENARFWERESVARYLRHARGVYDLSAPTFLSHPPQQWTRWFSRASLHGLRHLRKVARMETLHDLNLRYFPEAPHLLQIFDRFATYNGSSPYRTPAAFCIIPYVQARFGGWWVQGGLYNIARQIQALAESRGARFHFSTPVDALELCDPAGRYTLKSHGTGLGEFDAVICNTDVLSAFDQLLPDQHTRAFREHHLQRHDLSLSGFVMMLAVEKTFPQLDHHNIFFSSDYPREFRGLFDLGSPADDPTIYAAISAKTEPGRAPEGCENWFVLVNAPNARHPKSRVDWAGYREEYGDLVLKILEKDFGLEGLRQSVRHREFITPHGFQDRYAAFGGGLYGFASHGPFTAFQRPPLRVNGLPNLLFTGGSTHPGGGIPLVLRSGRMAAQTLLGEGDPLPR